MPLEEKKNGEVWFSEVHGNKQSLGIKVKEVHHHSKSKYQDILIFDSESYGKVLVLDDALMLSDIDEHMYHKALTFYGLENTSKEKDLNVLVIGAGDGGIVRNLLRNYGERIAHIDMVEIDQEVIDLSRKYFPDIACELDNPKLNLLCEDALKFVENASDGAYDLILCDSTDPVGFAAGLIEEDFYRTIKRIMSEDAIFCAQSGSPFFQRNELDKARANLSKVFAEVHTYYAPMLVYPGGFWSYTAAGKQLKLKENLDMASFVS